MHPVLLCALTIAAPGPPLPRAVAWLGSWQAMRSPAVPAPAQDGRSSGDLDGVFDVAWQREGEHLAVTITRRTEAWCGRLCVEVPFPVSEAMLLGCRDLPVRVPLAGQPNGQRWWTWGRGDVLWAVAEAGAERPAMMVASLAHHGVFLLQRDDGPALQLALDAPKLGESVSFALRVRALGEPESLRAEARRWLGVGAEPPLDRAVADRLRAGGFIKVGGSGWAFETAAGQPYYAIGRNLAHLATLAPAEQEQLLDQVVAAKSNTVRLLLPDFHHMPTPTTWNDAGLLRLREAVDRCAARGVRVILCLEYSGAGNQFSNSRHLSDSAGDIYLRDDTFAVYRRRAEAVVTAFRDDPAVLAWDITNEPFVDADPRSQVLASGFRAWLRQRYGTLAGLQAAWGAAPDSFEAAALPQEEEYERQSTPAARDFFTFAQRLLAEGLIRRARRVRELDPNHLITLSGGFPRLLRGHRGAELFDFWAPHSYDLWVNGPVIDEHVAYLVQTLRWALPDRPRPVVLEEFGISEGPNYPEALRAEHIAQFLAAGQRHGLAGVMHWWDMTPAQDEAFATAAPYRLADRPGGPASGFLLPPEAEYVNVFYARYMTAAPGAGPGGAAGGRPRVRFVGTADEAPGLGPLATLRAGS